MKGADFESYLVPVDREMYYKNMNRARDWFKLAENDYLWAKDTLAAKRYAQAVLRHNRLRKRL